MRSSFLVLLVTLNAIAFVGCSGSSSGSGTTAVAKGNRLLALDLTEAETQTYDDAIASSLSIGADEVDLFFNWTAIGV